MNPGETVAPAATQMQYKQIAAHASTANIDNLSSILLLLCDLYGQA